MVKHTGFSNISQEKQSETSSLPVLFFPYQSPEQRGARRRSPSPPRAGVTICKPREPAASSSLTLHRVPGCSPRRADPSVPSRPPAGRRRRPDPTSPRSLPSSAHVCQKRERPAGLRGAAPPAAPHGPCSAARCLPGERRHTRAFRF